MAMHMHNPPHPGEILKGLFLKPARVTMTAFAAQLGVDRKTISRLVNGRHAITAEMALRIGAALGNSPEMWLGIQQDYDLWQARQQCSQSVRRIAPLPEFRPQA